MDRPKNGWRLNEHSFWKMIVWFKDGNIRTFYSLDWKTKYSGFRDPRIGLARLKNLTTKYGVKAGTIEIYNMESGAIIAKYYEGLEVAIEKPVQSKTNNTNEEN